MMNEGWLLRRIAKTACRIVLATFSIAACQACAATKYPSGGPHYYGNWAPYFLPIRPTEPLSPAEARTRSAYCEAFFDADGRIVKFRKYINGKVQFETSYSYRADKSFEEYSCHEGKVVVTVYDKHGERSSNQTDAGCAIGKQDGDSGQGLGSAK
jgi:hypothetical protein